MSLGFNSVALNTISFAKVTHERFLLEYLKNANYSVQEIKNVEIVKMSKKITKKISGCNEYVWQNNICLNVFYNGK